MRVFTKSGILAATLLALGTAASAAVLDFTTLSTFTTTAAGSATGPAGAGNGFTITASGGPLTYNVTSGPGAVGGLAGETDGIGVADDEIGGNQYVTIIFDKPVRLTGASFLDMFSDVRGDAEVASVYAGTPPSGAGFLGSVTGTQVFSVGAAGFASIGGLSTEGTTFSFDAGVGNDGVGIGDFALAGLTFDNISMVVPLPAGALLLGTALWGFGIVGRRRRH